ncbi:MAG: YceI family protein [Candidatus Binatia bacterium]|nr:YceI family protein [Candidatus Binatia bacterium]
MSTRVARTLTLAALCGLVVGTPANPAQAACTYSVGEDPVKVEWTAFKLTEKLGVTGTFNTTTLSGPTEAASLVDLAKGLSMEIDGTSIESDNPGRNATISQFFFQEFASSPNITGKVESVDGDDSKGTLKIAVTMNGATKAVPFAYTISKDHGVEATATIDMMDFAMQKPFDSLHRACEEQHTGEDGVSKTWTDVVLKLSGKFAESCN